MVALACFTLGAKFYDDEAQEIDVTQGSRVLKYIRRMMYLKLILS